MLFLGIAILMGIQNTEKDLVMAKNNIIKYSVQEENTKTKKVPLDDTVAIANPGKYKDMDYGFLKDYDYGSVKQAEAGFIFETVEEMKSCTARELKEGTYVRTKGYNKALDGGGASYLIVSEGENTVALDNGLYAKLIPDAFIDKEGGKWAIINVRQFGAIGDAKKADHISINAAFSYGNILTEKEEYDRAIVYLPEGEYKCDNQIFVHGHFLNIVGEGEKTILFTDNDYRKQEGYSEHFFQITEAKETFLGNFTVEAREVDLYHYMRQFTVTYAEQIYIYNVDMIIPQESYSSYYFEDKQYSNFCCYTGNSDITVDGCKIVQLSGTYRGANIGILDIWSAGEKNITIMNCDLYGNAKDEQIGIFSTSKDSASIKGVDFINNTIHSVQLKYTEIIGYRIMCFSIAYSDSKNVEDIRVAGNHFICEVDSKFMTFGAVKNCVVEDNIIEVISSCGARGTVFDSSNGDPNNIIVRNNEFYLTGKNSENTKNGIVAGCLTLKENRFFTDAIMGGNLVDKNCIIKGNEIIALGKAGTLISNCFHYKNNTSYFYGGLGKLSIYNLKDDTAQAYITGNIIYDYKRSIEKKSAWSAINEVNRAKMKSVHFNNNSYYAPNKRFTDVDAQTGEDVYNRIFYYNNSDDGNVETLEYKNNVLQGVSGIITYGNIKDTKLLDYNNTVLPYTVDIDEKITSSIAIQYGNEIVREITISNDSVDLDEIVHVAASLDEDGNIIEEVAKDKEIRWYTNVEGLATVSKEGIVTRKMYGSVNVYAVALDGSGIYGKCTVHFIEKRADSVQFAKEQIDLQPGLKYYMDYKVFPVQALQKLDWSSSNEAVATVSFDGTIEAMGVGEAIITGLTKDGTGTGETLKVTVSPVTVKKIELDNNYLYFENNKIGTMQQLSVQSYYPENAVNKSVKRWESSNDSVVTVDNNGRIKIVGSGVAEVFAYSTDEKCFGRCGIYVQPSKVKNLKAESITKTSVKLTWDADENSYGYYIYQWNEMNSKWEVLNQGTYIAQTSFTVKGLTANKNYRFCVRAFISNRESGTRQIYESEEQTVYISPQVEITEIKLNQEKYIVGLGKKKDISIICMPEDADACTLQWSSEQSDIASIKEKNNETESKNTAFAQVTGEKTGVTTVKVLDPSGSGIFVQAKVIVLPGVPNHVKGIEEQEQIVIQWEPVENADGYFVYRAEKDSTKWTRIAEVNANQYTCKQEADKASYKYKISAYIIDEDEKYEGDSSSYYNGVNIEEIIWDDQIYTISDYKYKIIGKNTVKVVGCNNRNCVNIVMKDKIKINNKTYKITKISSSAFKEYKKLKKVIVGKNIKKIEANAFKNCNKLKKIVYKGTNVQSIGKNVWKGIHKNAKFQVAKSVKGKYKKLHTKKTGYLSTMQITVK